MELNKAYAQNVPEDFFKEFIERLAPYPFGGMSKRDLDCLIFYLLRKHDLIPGEKNRDRAYSLNISETKYKSYIVDADAKYGRRDMENNVKSIFGRLKNGEPGISVEGDTLVFIEDDPVVREDFMQDLKSEGFCPDSSFNEELVKVNAASFLLYAYRKGLLDDKKVIEIFNKDKADKDRIKTIVNSKKTPKDIVADVFGIFENHGSSLIETVAALLKYVPGIVSAKSDKGKAQ